MTEAIRVLLADDHAVVRAGVRAILALELDLDVVGEAATGEEAQHLSQELVPDVVLLDLSMPGPSALETTDFLRQYVPHTRVVILTAYHDYAVVRRLVALGVSGYVLKDDAPDTVAAAIRSAAQGGTWLSPAITSQLSRRTVPGSHQSGTTELTERERQVLDLLAEGGDNARIATQLGLSDQTVRNYLRRVYEKLGVHSRAEVLVWLRDHQLGAL